MSNTLIYLTKNNSNAIVSMVDDTELARTTSNAFLFCCKNTSNTLTYLTKNNSNAIIALKASTGYLDELLRNTSNAMLFGDKNNSNTLLYLNNNNSNALLNCCKNTSNTLLYLNKNNSNAIVKNSKDIRVNSNAMINCCKNMSNTLLYLTNNNSNAIINIKNSTQSSSELLRVTSNALLFCCKNTSNALLTGDKNNSNTLLYLNRTLSNAFTNCCKNMSNTLLYLTRTYSNGFAYEIKNNSNAIVAGGGILARTTSNALLFCCKNTSNTLIYLTKNNSNAIIALQASTGALEKLLRTTSNAVLFGDKNNSNTLLYLNNNNSNTLLNCCKNMSNTLLYLTRTYSNGFAYEIKNNSNAIIAGGGILARTTSNALIFCCKNTSNTLIYLTKNNSNAIVSLIDDTELARTTSNALLFCCKNTSNAQLAADKNNSNALLYLTTNNSNAIVAIKQSLPCVLTIAPVTTDVFMTRNCIVGPQQTIHITNDLTIDGQGAWIMFDKPQNSQFILDPNITVTLRNVNLLRITDNTFQFGQNSRLQIEKDVVFELEEDVYWANENIRLLGTASNQNLFTVRGHGGQKRWVIEPVTIGTDVVKTLDIGFNEMALENVILSGLDSIAVSRELIPGTGYIAGAIGLLGQADVIVDNDTNMNFDTEGPDNHLFFTGSGLTMHGFVLFSSFFESDLHMAFQLQQKITSYPELFIDDNVIYLASQYGNARLYFDDYYVVLTHLGSNSFVTDNNSFMSGRNVEINDWPVKQQSNNLTLDTPLSLRSSNLPNAIDMSFVRRGNETLKGEQDKPATLRQASDFAKATTDRQGERSLDERNPDKRRHDVITALKLKRTRQVYNAVTKQKNNQALYNKIKPKKRLDDTFDTPETSESEDFNMLTRAFPIPTSYDLVVNSHGVKMSDASRVIKVEGTGVMTATLIDFGIGNQILDTYMFGNASLEQGANDVTFKSGDSLFVSGKNNSIVVSNKMIFNGPIIFDEGAELTFIFDPRAENPAIIFNAAYNDTIRLPLLSKLEFRGNGTIWFVNGKKFVCQGTSAKNKPIIAFTESAHLRLSEQAHLGVSGEATIDIPGQCFFTFDSGAQATIERNQQLILGSENGGDVSLRIDRSSIVEIRAPDATSSTQEARLSINKGKCSIDVQQGGTLDIGPNGIFEINSLNDTKVGGLISHFNVRSGGILNLDYDGMMIIGRNGLQTPSQQEMPFTFSTLGGTLHGSGVVRLAETEYSGRIQNFSFPSVEVTAQEFVRALINIIPSLNFSTYFIDGAGNKKLLNDMRDLYRYKQPIYDLYVDDDIRSDSPLSEKEWWTGYVYGYNNNVEFAILPNGDRR